MEYTIWELIFKTGWTIEYIEALPMARLRDYINIMDAQAKARGI